MGRNKPVKYLGGGTVVGCVSARSGCDVTPACDTGGNYDPDAEVGSARSGRNFSMSA
jgi:hypothetical protein